MKAQAFILIALTALSACTGSTSGESTQAVPRRYAYPRFTPYPDSTMRAGAGGLHFEVNAYTKLSNDRPDWLNITYPAYGATVMLAVHRPDNMAELAAAIDNRKQRIALNLGGNTARTDRFRNDMGFECEITVSPETASTPVQFLAVGPGREIVSGAAVMSEAGNPDSISPICAALEHDIFHLLNTLE